MIFVLRTDFVLLERLDNCTWLNSKLSFNLKLYLVLVCNKKHNKLDIANLV